MPPSSPYRNATCFRKLPFNRARAVSPRIFDGAPEREHTRRVDVDMMYSKHEQVGYSIIDFSMRIKSAHRTPIAAAAAPVGISSARRTPPEIGGRGGQNEPLAAAILWKIPVHSLPFTRPWPDAEPRAAVPSRTLFMRRHRELQRAG